ncbi:hypothetical protein [Oryza sativa Japonica Group]|uniref:Uncharacterized protein n=1 Tax=Oryza sativa subsp. japonica TaxID=39947 RepID=Q5N7D3_ORYSJ|nr:hypothetical protein [Oryza sativa Japonica Group]
MLRLRSGETARACGGERRSGSTSAGWGARPRATPSRVLQPAKPTLPIPGEGRWRDELQGGARTAVNRRGPEEAGELRQA